MMRQFRSHAYIIIIKIMRLSGAVSGLEERVKMKFNLSV